MEGRANRGIDVPAIVSVCLIAMLGFACAGRRYPDLKELAALAAAGDLNTSPFSTIDNHEAPAQIASPTAINFGRVHVREDKSAVVTLVNPTNAPLTVRWVSTGNLGDY